MTHLSAGGAGTTAPPAMINRPHRPFEGHHLDLDRLRQGIAGRRQRMLDLEVALVAACETAAARGRSNGVYMDDRETWDRATWSRYLAAAARLEPDYGPKMRKLLQEIDQLSRLTELPVAMEQAA